MFYEYHAEMMKSIARLNELGAGGWDLVAVTCYQGDDYCYFKRKTMTPMPEPMWKGKKLSELKPEEKEDFLLNGAKF